MPILFDERIHPIGQDEFHQVDRIVMGLVFAIQNEFGRVYDEKIYQAELLLRCRKAGLTDSEKEVPIHVVHGSFRKILYIDLLIGRGALYELKAVAELNDEHRRQALNYLLLAGLQHGKMVNFRPPSVQHEFVSTTLTDSSRRQFIIRDLGWVASDEDSAWLRATFEELLQDWGAFVDTTLFMEAICHFRGGTDAVVKAVDVFGTDGHVLGTQRCRLLNPETAFTLTALRRAIKSYENHLRKFLSHTNLSTLQWINLNGHEIELTTLAK